MRKEVNHFTEKDVRDFVPAPWVVELAPDLMAEPNKCFNDLKRNYGWHESYSGGNNKRLSSCLDCYYGEQSKAPASLTGKGMDGDGYQKRLSYICICINYLPFIPMYVFDDSAGIMYNPEGHRRRALMLDIEETEHYVEDRGVLRYVHDQVLSKCMGKRSRPPLLHCYCWCCCLSLIMY